MTTVTRTQTSYTGSPRPPVLVVLAETLQPLAHGDPDHASGGNISPFRRQEQMVPVADDLRPIVQGDLDRITAVLPLPSDLAVFVPLMTCPQYLASGFLATFLALYNGQGLLDGPERYQRLGDRARIAARCSPTAAHAWTDLCKKLQVGGSAKQHPALLPLMTMPNRLWYLVREDLDSTMELVALIARTWHAAWRDDEKERGTAPGLFTMPPVAIDLPYRASTLPQPASTVIRPVPSVSGNSIRHNMLRNAALTHLLEHLHIGANQLPPALANTMANGGGLDKGVSMPTNAAQLGEQVASRYAFFAALGGCLPSFMLPPSQIAVEPYLVCEENRLALARWGIVPEHPAEALISLETEVRMGTDPMPSAREVLVPGAQLAVGFTLAPFASDHVMGVLGAALRQFQSRAQTGGKGNTGHGFLSLSYVESDELQAEIAEYEADLADRHDVLREGLVSGMLGTKSNLLVTTQKADKGTKSAKAKESLFDEE